MVRNTVHNDSGELLPALCRQLYKGGTSIVSMVLVRSFIK